MLDTSKILYSYNDVMVKPTIISEVSSRSECNPFLENGKLPIFTAPMSTVVNLENRHIFEENHILTILPRNIEFKERYESALRGEWAAFSLNEFIEKFCGYTYITNNTETPWRVLIDIANGHMKKLFEVVKIAKKQFGNKIQIMIGNIANPETFEKCVEAGVDFVRCGIGSGEGCITSTVASIHYPMASLLDDIVKVKKRMMDEIRSTQDYLSFEEFRGAMNQINSVKIIADGGIRDYGDVIKALALGADYVMIGGLFASLEESAGKIISIMGKPHKEFYGMASRDGQIAINGEKTKTSEGTKKFLPIIGTVERWTTNMSDYLRSAMSYCGIKDIKDFNAKNVSTILISNNTKNSINK